jgi:hypothetical protein
VKESNETYSLFVVFSRWTEPNENDKKKFLCHQKLFLKQLRQQFQNPSYEMMELNLYLSLLLLLLEIEIRLCMCSIFFFLLLHNILPSYLDQTVADKNAFFLLQERSRLYKNFLSNFKKSFSRY